MAKERFTPCYNHHEREGVTRCIRCLKSLCRECSNTYDGEVYCSVECAKAAQKFAIEAEELKELDDIYKSREKVTDFKSFLVACIVTLVILFVSFLVFVFFVPEKSKLDFINSLPEQLSLFKNIFKFFI